MTPDQRFKLGYFFYMLPFILMFGGILGVALWFDPLAGIGVILVLAFVVACKVIGEHFAGF
jgi:hypothetical protein